MSSKNSELAIVIPTYNEADNIELLVLTKTLRSIYEFKRK